MKKVCNSALRCKGNSIFLNQAFFTAFRSTIFIAGSLLMAGMIFTGCMKKEAHLDEAQNLNNQAVSAAAENDNVVFNYSGLSGQTVWELQQARAASARYRKLDNAIRDGYVNIDVVVPNMGYHYLKPSLVDNNFDPRSPEILVYNKDDKGDLQLVAVEYAVPLSDPRPEGFSGTSDVWDGNAGFQLWLLHAWVWSYNPDGVFNPTNPLVHLH